MSNNELIDKIDAWIDIHYWSAIDDETEVTVGQLQEYLQSLKTKE